MVKRRKRCYSWRRSSGLVSPHKAICILLTLALLRIISLSIYFMSPEGGIRSNAPYAFSQALAYGIVVS